MKKSLATGLIAAMVLGVAGTAFADPADSSSDPLQVSGSFKYETRNNHDNAAAGSHTTDNRFYAGVNLDWKADANTTFFGRIAGESHFGKATPANENDFKMDQYGVKTNMDGWNFSLGRQGVQLGQGGTLYAGVDIGPLTYFDGAVVTSKLGDVNFKAVGGKVTAVNEIAATDSTPGTDFTSAQNWWGLEVNQDITKDFNFGLTYAKKKNLTDSNTVEQNLSTNYWSAFTTVKGGPITWTGEYIKSNANQDNNAYDVTGTYAWNKNSVTVAYNYVNANAVDFSNSYIGGVYYPNGAAFLDGYKGATYVYHHDMTKLVGFNVYYMALKPMHSSDGAGTDGEFAANVKWSF